MLLRDFILKQGASGDDFFVLEEGTVEFRVDGKKVTNAPATFGELALSYNSPRNADVVAASTYGFGLSHVLRSVRLCPVLRLRNT